MSEAPARVRMSPAARREQLITVATRLIAESGFNSLTMSRLASEAGLTRAGVEYHFPSREDVLLAVLLHRDQADEEAVMAHLGPMPLAPAVLWQSFADFVNRNSQQREIVRLYAFLGAEALDPTHPAHNYFQARLTYTRGVIAKAAAGWAPNPDVLAIEVLAFMDGIQLQWLRDPSLDLNALWGRAAHALQLSMADPQ